MKVKVNGAWVDVPAFKVVEQTGVPLEQVETILHKTDGELIIPEGVTTLRGYAFYYYNTTPSGMATNVVLPSTLKTINVQAFRLANIKSITLPSTITSVNTHVFWGSSLETCIWRCNYAYISNFVFFECKKLKKVVIDAPIVGVNTSAFGSCTALEELDFSACNRVPSLGALNAFTNVPTTCTIKIPSALYSAWTTATNWATLVAQGYNFVAV